MQLLYLQKIRRKVRGRGNEDCYRVVKACDPIESSKPAIMICMGRGRAAQVAALNYHKFSGVAVQAWTATGGAI
jgi:hypothetical protein